MPIPLYWKRWKVRVFAVFTSTQATGPFTVPIFVLTARNLPWRPGVKHSKQRRAENEIHWFFSCGNAGSLFGQCHYGSGTRSVKSGLPLQAAVCNKVVKPRSECRFGASFFKKANHGKPHFHMQTVALYFPFLDMPIQSNQFGLKYLCRWKAIRGIAGHGL